MQEVHEFESFSCEGGILHTALSKGLIEIAGLYSKGKYWLRWTQMPRE